MLSFSLPQIRLINQEVKDPSAYLSPDWDVDKLELDFSVKPYDIFDNGLVFFVHILLEHNSEKSGKQKLFHFDYVIVLKTQDSIDKDKELKVVKEELAHFLGMSILMIRGSLMTTLQYHPLEEFSIPMFNPLTILEEILDEENGNFIIDPNTMSPAS